MKFHVSSRKSEIFHFDGLLLSNSHKVSAKKERKKYWRVISHDTEEWCKVQGNLRFQIWHEEFGEFSPNHSKSENFISVGSFYSKYIRFQLKKIQRNYLSWCKFWINPDLVASKMAWGIGWTFIRALKSEKLYIDELFWSKAFNVLARKLQRKYVSWYWKAIQNLKENWLVAWKMT